MEQATQPTAPSDTRAPDADREEYKRASALMDRIVGQLANLPRSAAVVGDLTGFRIRLNFGSNNPSGVLEFAGITDVPTLREAAHDYVWFEARTTIENIPVCAEALLTAEAAVAFDAQTPGPNPGPTTDTPATADPVRTEPVIVPVTGQAPGPLGASVTAYEPMALHATAQGDAAGDEQ